MMKGIIYITVILAFFNSSCKQTAEDFYYKGKNKELKGDLKGAKSDYEKAIELRPDLDYIKEALLKVESEVHRSFTNFFNQGAEYYKNKNYEKSVEYFTKAIELIEDGEAYYYRGAGKFLLGDKDGACSDWLKASVREVKGSRDNIKKHCQ